MKMIGLAILFLIMLFSCNIGAGEVIPTHIKSKSAKIDITTTKVSHVGLLDSQMAAEAYIMETVSTLSVPGDRIVIIDSRGGSVQVGMMIIAAMNKERERAWN